MLGILVDSRKQSRTQYINNRCFYVKNEHQWISMINHSTDTSSATIQASLRFPGETFVES